MIVFDWLIIGMFNLLIFFNFPSYNIGFWEYYFWIVVNCSCIFSDGIFVNIYYPPGVLVHFGRQMSHSTRKATSWTLRNVSTQMNRKSTGGEKDVSGLACAACLGWSGSVLYADSTMLVFSWSAHIVNNAVQGSCHDPRWQRLYIFARSNWIQICNQHSAKLVIVLSIKNGDFCHIVVSTKQWLVSHFSVDQTVTCVTL